MFPIHHLLTLPVVYRLTAQLPLTTMRSLLTSTVVALLTAVIPAEAVSSSSPFFGGHSINLRRLESNNRNSNAGLIARDIDTSQIIFNTEKTYDEFPTQYFEQPLDHFSDDPHTFKQRYWVNSRHYKKGGPVFLLDGGETSGEDRLPFLDTGILEILSKETNGLGIVIEHRYYGGSIPVANFSTDSLR